MLSISSSLHGVPVVAGRQSWSPAALPVPPALWLDAALAGSITLETGQVAQWRDRNGSGPAATQPNTARRGFLNLAGINGQPAIEFDNTEMVLPGLGLSGPITAFAVCAPDLNDLSGFPKYLYLDGDLRVAEQRKPMLFAWDQEPGQIRTGIATQWQGVVRPAGPMILSTRIDAAHFTTRYDGAEVFSEPTVGLPQAGTATGMIGARDGACLWGEVLVIPAALDPAQIERVEGYLAHRWAMQGQLPPGHAYRTRQP